MKILIALLMLSSLSGCAVINHYYNSQDLCQSYNKPKDWTRPDFCGAGSGRVANINVQRIGPGSYKINNY